MASPIFAIVILVEIILSNYQERKVYSFKETVTNFYLSLLNGALDLAIRSGYFFIMMYCFQLRLWNLETNFFYWAGLVVGLDLLFYGLHRMEHFSRLFWAVHVTHHSSDKMNFSVAFRASVFQPLYRFMFFIPLAFLGFEPIDILFVYSLTMFWTLFVHTEFIGKLGWMEKIFVTPSHHRVHHASNDKYLDRNMGQVFIIWDRLFGTFQEELPADEYEPIRYGLTTPPGSKGPINIIFHEFVEISNDLGRKDLDWKDKVSLLVRPPGWLSKEEERKNVGKSENDYSEGSDYRSSVKTETRR
jgi:sterol desaturase/sphingolipid hydroxylase (fatty acid hydroxylase superfamily)